MSCKRMVVSLICLCIGLAAGVGSAQPEERPIITVLDFKASSISTSEIELFVDYLTSYIVETNMFRVIDRSQRQSILEELEIGKLLAASQIIVGSIGKVGDRYLLSIKLIDVQTGQTLRSEARDCPRLESANKEYGSLYAPSFFLAAGAEVMAFGPVALGLEGGYVFPLTSEPYGGTGEYYSLYPYFLGLTLGVNFEGGPEARAAARLAELRHCVLAGAGLIEFSLNASYVLSWARMMGVTVGLGYGLQPDRYYAAAGGLLFPWEWFDVGLRVGYARAGLEGNTVCLEPLLLLRYKWLALALSTVQPSYSLVSIQAGVSF